MAMLMGCHICQQGKKQLLKSSIFNVRQNENLPLTAMQTATLKGPFISKLLHCSEQRWPETVTDDLKPYWLKCTEISIKMIALCVVFGCRHCQAVQNNPPVIPFHPWIWPSEPWSHQNLLWTHFLSDC